MPKSLLMLCKYYAAGKVDLETFRRQRRELICSELALEGDLTRPMDVADFQDVTVRPAMAHVPVGNYNERVPDVDSGSIKLNRKIVALLIAAAVSLAVVSVIYLLNANEETSKVVNISPQTSERSFSPGLTAVLESLLKKDDWWEVEDVSAFIGEWRKASDSELLKLRHDLRFSQLKDDIRSHISLGGGDVDDETRKEIEKMEKLISGM